MDARTALQHLAAELAPYRAADEAAVKHYSLIDAGQIYSWLVRALLHELAVRGTAASTALSDAGSVSAGSLSFFSHSLRGPRMEFVQALMPGVGCGCLRGGRKSRRRSYNKLDF